VVGVQTGHAQQPLIRYLVELTPAESGYEDIQALVARSRAACQELTRPDAPVRFLRSVYVPEDGSCFLLFEARSAPVVEEAGRRAALRVARLSETLRVPRMDTERAPQEVDRDGQ
jgi:hypothetical protein